MKQRLGIAQAILHQPKLLILDEPTNGLDPEGIIEMRLLLKELAKNGTTIIVSSHLLSEIEHIATNESFPFEQILSFILLGWLATFPMIALQLFASMHWHSFAVSFTMNIFFTIPSILAINSERFGPFYPWAQPFFMMYPSENSLGFSLISIQQMILVTGVSFLIFFLMGIISFHRKNI